jgi:hypothetical protein
MSLFHVFVPFLFIIFTAAVQKAVKAVIFQHGAIQAGPIANISEFFEESEVIISPCISICAESIFLNVKPCHGLYCSVKRSDEVP